MNEREFLYSLCARALEVDKSIKFAAVVDLDGKLIVGTFRQCFIQKNEIIDNNFFKSRLNHPNHFESNDNFNLNSFINNNNTFLHSNLFSTSDFQLFYINKNIFIAFAPLTEEQDKYLCIYFDSSTSLHKTLLKLNTIFECNE
ncbi:MAG: hypothetical protein ABJB76_03490 [Candidatus Nitrosocosmicus sp.]